MVHAYITSLKDINLWGITGRAKRAPHRRLQPEKCLYVHVCLSACKSDTIVPYASDDPYHKRNFTSTVHDLYQNNYNGSYYIMLV